MNIIQRLRDLSEDAWSHYRHNTIPVFDAATDELYNRLTDLPDAEIERRGHTLHVLCNDKEWLISPEGELWNAQQLSPDDSNDSHLTSAEVFNLLIN